MTRSLRPFSALLTAALLVMFCVSGASAQQRKDSLSQKEKRAAKPVTPDTSLASKDTARKERSEAGKAALRSAVLPGWGQAYNRKYWKIPIVYGALAIPVATFSYNLQWYRKCREAYNIRFYNDTSVVTPDLPTDGIDPQLKPLSTSQLRLYRNEFRKNVDFSVLAFIALWGLNVVDAAVDGHLRSFNVSEDLSLRLDAVPSPVGMSGTVGLVWHIGRRREAAMARGR
jgi:hypothetical protein